MVQKSKMSPVSPSEAEILQLLWQLERGTVQQISDRLPASRQIGYATVQTLLRRLEKKGYIRHEVQGKAHVFSPLVGHEEAVGRSVREFVKRLFAGDPVPLMMHLASSGMLKKKDIDKLRQILDKEEKP